MSRTSAICDYLNKEMVKRTCSLLTLIVLVLTQCFTPIDYVLAENNAEQDFQIAENIDQEEEEETTDISEVEEDTNDSITDIEDEEENEETITTNVEDEETIENTSSEVEDSEGEQEVEPTEPTTTTDNNEQPTEPTEPTTTTDNNEQPTEPTEPTTTTDNNEQPTEPTEPTTTTDNNEQPTEPTEPTTGTDNNEQPTEPTEPTTGTNNNEQTTEPTTEPTTGTDNNDQTTQEQITPSVKTGDNEEGIIETITEEIEEIITKIRYFFKKEGDSRYIKYGKDSNNIGTITLKDPNNGTSITIMDKNLGAESVGVGKGSYGYYFQWGNNYGVKTVNSSNKTTQKAVYKDSYYSHGYDGGGLFIVGDTDYWDDGAHYNSLWGSESKESSRYGACPVGYHIPTMKEWNELLSIWGKIHTQDTSAGNMVLRYSENYSTRNIHTFKGAVMQCAQGETECVDEDKLSTIIEVLSSELKLPKAGSYDENGNYHDGLGVYWTTISKNGNKAGVFDVDAYLGGSANERLQYKSQGHSIRCFKNLYPYEAPVQPEDNDNGEQEQEIQENQEQQNQQEQNQQEQQQENEQQEQQEQAQNTYSVNNIPQEYVSYTLVLDTEKELVNLELKANGGKFENEEETKTLKYGYYNQEATINLEALKQDEYRSGYELEEGAEKQLTIPAGYKLMDEIETPNREGYDFDGWYTEAEGGEKMDIDTISENTQVYAHWIAKEYTITWKNEDGTVRDVTKVLYGQMPTHEDPVQPSDEKYSYIFAGWEPSIKVVDGDAEYRAKYTYIHRKYTVTWKDEDGNILKTDEIAYGTIPTYNGETPIKESTEEYSYTFAGWEPEIIEVRGNTEYIAKFDTKEIENEHTGDNDTGNNDTGDNSQTAQNGSQANPYDGSGEIITGEIETGSALDLLKETLDEQIDTGEVVEYTEEDRELELAEIWKTLNNKKIKGKETYNNVTVNVEAPKGTFPKGVELKIIPITGNEQKQAIKDELIEKTDVTEESEVVSFDISFIYTLKNGEEIEIQPKEGKTVKVVFNYKNNNKFNKEKNNELKVYHFEKVENKKGKKSEEIDVKEIKIKELESKDEEIVIDAENFSIYLIAAVDSLGKGQEDLNTPMLKAISRTSTDGLIRDNTKGTVTIQLNANGGSFSDNSTVKNLDYGFYNREETKYSYSSNYGSNNNDHTDPGNPNTTQNLTTDDTTTTDSVTINGAEKLSASITYDLGYSAGFIGIGSYTDYLTTYRGIGTSNQIERISGSANSSKTYSISDNSVTFVHQIGNRLFNNITNKGYYATVIGTIPVGWMTEGVEEPSRDGYLFDDWYTDTTYANVFDDENYNFNNGGTTVYAKWNRAYTVTFDSDGGSNIEPQKIVAGQLATKPENPTKLGYSFLDWYSDSELTSVFNFSSPITGDIILYAKWDKKDTVSVVFNSNGGSSIASQEIEYGDRVIKPANPTKSNQIFKYWTTDSEGNNVYDFDIAVITDLELYAQWGNICTVTFTNGTCYNGTTNNTNNRGTCTFNINPTTVNVACGTPLRRPEDPSSPVTVRMGNNNRTVYFSRWSRTQQPGPTNTSNNYDFDTPVTGPITIYAIGNTTSYTVTFNANGGKLVGTSSEDIDRDTLGQYGLARQPDNPIRTGYTFQRWSESQINGTEFNFNTTPITDNITLYAQWAPIMYRIKYNSNGGSGNMSDMFMAYMMEENLTPNSFTKANASFSGWNTKANGNGIRYEDEKLITNLATISGSVINLYAQWNCNSGYHDEGGVCVNNVQNCEFQGQTIANGSDLTVYSTSSTTCPIICTTGIVTCTNGVLGGNTGYTNLSCSPTSTTCDASFTLLSTGANGLYSSCTPYTTNGNSCSAGITKYKLDSCSNGYHTEDNTTCISNTSTAQCNTGSTPANATSIITNVPITWNNGSWSAPANCAWTCNPHYHTGANNNSCEIDMFQITWKDGNRATLKTDTVNYNLVPSYSGTTPTKTSTAEYTYTFNGNWSPTPVAATADATYTAQFDATTNNYTINIVSNNTNSGTVSQSSVTVPYGTNISTNGTTLTIGFNTITANPNIQTAQYNFSFVNWTNPCGDQVVGSCTITANFNSSLRNYTVTWKNSDGTTLETDNNVPYGAMPSYDGAIPTSGGDAQYRYVFNGWSPSTGIVEGDTIYTATYIQNLNEYTVTIRSSNINSGTVTTGSITVPYGTTISEVGNVVTIGSETSTANANPQTRQYDFNFVNWTGTCGNTVTTGCEITANFESLLRTYTLDLVVNTGIETIYYKINGADSFTTTGVTTTISGVEAGSTIYAYAEAKDGYTHVDTSVGSPWSVLVTGNNVFSPEAVANTGIQYTVYHYVKRVGENTYALTDTDILSGTTDQILTLSSLSKESEFMCAHYSSGSLTGTESGPGEIVTETTIKGDNSTKIYLYYTRESHRVTLVKDEHTESVTGDGVRECGSEVPVDATPKPGYHFVRWDREESRRSEESENDDLENK